MPRHKPTGPVWSEVQIRELARRALTAVSGIAPTENELEEVVQGELQDFIKQAAINQKDASAAFSEEKTKDAEAVINHVARHGHDSVSEALAWGGAQASIANPHATFQQCAEAFQTARARDGRVQDTLDRFWQRLKPFFKDFGDRPVRSVTVAEMAGYLNRWPRVNTRIGQWGDLNGLYLWMVETGHVDKNLVKLAMARPKAETSSGLIYTPYEVMRILRETMFTDQLGFWVLSLFGGLRIHEIRRLHKHPNPWGFINLRQGELTLPEEITRTRSRVVLIMPVLRSWLLWMKERNTRFYPPNFKENYPLMQIFILRRRFGSRMARRRKEAPANLRTINAPRRTFLSYRMAIMGVDLAAASHQSDMAESYLIANYAHKASEADARAFFSLTPIRIRKASIIADKENLQIQLNFKRGAIKRQRMTTAPTSTSDAPRTRWVVGGARDPKVVAFEEKLVSFFVDAAELLGVPKSVAAVYGLVFSSSEPPNFTEISARLNFSSGSVSQALKVLREIGAIKSTHIEKDKLERFAPDLELRKLIARFIEHRLEKQLKAGSNHLEELLHAVPSDDEDIADELKRRLKSLTDWHTRARQLLPIARTFLKLS